jgi:hypothetical protein
MPNVIQQRWPEDARQNHNPIYTAITVLLASAVLLSQQTTVAPNTPVGYELPVTMRQTVAAGKTPVGTRVEARLAVATLVNGKVVPRDAVLSGEVTESAGKSANAPSRLAIRLNSAQWKNGSAPLGVYLTAWFYPEVAGMAPQDLSYQPADAANSKKNWNGMGTYPDPNNPISQQKFPGPDTDKGKTTSPPAPSISKRRLLMKNVESLRTSDGATVIVSSHSNLKLDKFTTYVFATDDLMPKK